MATAGVRTKPAPPRKFVSRQFSVGSSRNVSANQGSVQGNAETFVLSEKAALRYRREQHPSLEASDGSLHPYPYWSTRSGRLCGKRACDPCYEGTQSGIDPLGSGVAFMLKHVKALSGTLGVAGLVSLPLLVLYHRAGYFQRAYGWDDGPMLARISMGNLGYGSPGDIADLGLSQYVLQWIIAGLDALSAAIILAGVMWMRNSETLEEERHRLRHITADVFSLAIQGLPADTTADELAVWLGKNVLRKPQPGASGGYDKLYEVVVAQEIEVVLALAQHRELISSKVEETEADLAKFYAQAGFDFGGKGEFALPTTVFVSDRGTFGAAMAAHASTELWDGWDDDNEDGEGGNDAPREERPLQQSSDASKPRARRQGNMTEDLASNCVDADMREKIADLWTVRHRLLARARAYQRRVLQLALEAPTVGAFVTFETRKASSTALRRMHRGWCSILSFGHYNPGLPLFRGKHVLTFTPAPRPSDILYENLGYTFLQRWGLVALTEMCSVVLLAVSLGLLFLSKEVLARSSNREVAAAFVPFGVAIVNVGLNVIIRILTKRVEKHASLDEQERSVFLRLFLRQTFNSAVFVVLVNSSFDPIARGDVSGTSSAPQSGPADGATYADMVPQWYYQVGSALVTVQVLNVIVPHLEKLVRAVLHAHRIRQWRLGLKQVKTQRFLNVLFTGPVQKLSIGYAHVLSIAVCTLMFSTSMPVLFLIAAITFALTAQVELLATVRLYRISPMYGLSIARTVNRVLLMALVLKLCIGLWALTSPAFSVQGMDTVLNALSGRNPVGMPLLTRVVRDYTIPHILLLFVTIGIIIADSVGACGVRCLGLLRCEAASTGARRAVGLSTRVVPVSDAMAQDYEEEGATQRSPTADATERENPREVLEGILSSYTQAVKNEYIADLPSYDPVKNPFYAAAFAVEAKTGDPDMWGAVTGSSKTGTHGNEGAHTAQARAMLSLGGVVSEEQLLSSLREAGIRIEDMERELAEAEACVTLSGSVWRQMKNWGRKARALLATKSVSVQPEVLSTHNTQQDASDTDTKKIRVTRRAK